MPCLCGSVTCPCRENCFCTERYCLCVPCNEIRGNLCCICHLPTYHQIPVHLRDNKTLCCTCFLSQSEVSQFEQNGTHESKNAKQSRAASKNRKVKSRTAPLPTASLDSSSKNISHRSSYESQSLPTCTFSNTAEISHRRAAGYSQVKETEKYLPVISLQETEFVIEQGRGESAQNQSPQEPQAATGFMAFHPISPEIDSNSQQLTSELSSLTISSTDIQPQTRPRKRQNTRRKSKKCSTGATKHKLTSTSESSDCPPLNISRQSVESSSYISPTGATASTTMRASFSGIYQAQTQSNVSTSQGSISINTMVFVPTTYGSPLRMPVEYGPPPFPSTATPPLPRNYLSPMLSSTPSSGSSNTPSKTPSREKHRRKMRTLPLTEQSLASSPEPHFRDRSNVRYWINTTEAATSQSPISHESEYAESSNLSHANAEKGNYGEASKGGHLSDIELTSRRVRQITDESNPYSSSIDYDTYFPNRDLENYEASGENTVSTTQDTTESSNISSEEAAYHIDNNSNVVAEHSLHSSNSLEDIPHDDPANYKNWSNAD